MSSVRFLSESFPQPHEPLSAFSEYRCSLSECYLCRGIAASPFSSSRQSQPSQRAVNFIRSLNAYVQLLQAFNQLQEATNAQLIALLESINNAIRYFESQFACVQDELMHASLLFLEAHRYAEESAHQSSDPFIDDIFNFNPQLPLIAVQNELKLEVTNRVLVTGDLKVCYPQRQQRTQRLLACTQDGYTVIPLVQPSNVSCYIPSLDKTMTVGHLHLDDVTATSMYVYLDGKVVVVAIGSCFIVDMQNGDTVIGPNLRMSREQAGIAALFRQVFLFGGLTNEGKPMKESECLTSLNAPSWSALPDMRHPRHSFTPACSLSCIYLCGGHTSIIEKFNPTTQQYTEFSMQLDESTCTLAAFSLRGMDEDILIITRHFSLHVRETENGDLRVISRGKRKGSNVWSNAPGCVWGQMLYAVSEMENVQFHWYSGHCNSHDVMWQ